MINNFLSNGKFSDLFYTCSLIEQIGRDMKLPRSEIVKQIGEITLARIFSHADVLHCELLEKNAEEFEKRCNITKGNFDNVSKCKYNVPASWAIGKVYARLIEDCTKANDCNKCENNADIVKVLIEVYTSWIDEKISNYNTDFFYQNREYIYECYKANEVLE